MNFILEKINNYRISKEYHEISKNPSNERANPLLFSKLSNFQKNINPTPRYNRITLPRLSYRTAPTPIHPSRSIPVNHPTLYSPLKNFSSKIFRIDRVNTASIKRGRSIRAFVPLIRRTREVMRGHRAYCPRERTLLVAITRLGMKNDRKSSMADGVEGRRRIGKRGGWLSISHRHCWL